MRSSIFLSSLLFVLLINMDLSAQQYEPPLLKVSGESTVKLPPDEVRLRVRIAIFQPELKPGGNVLQVKYREILTGLKFAGVEESDVKLGPPFKEQLGDGYRLWQDIHFRLVDCDKLDAVYYKLSRMTPEEVEIVDFRLSNTEEIGKRLRKEALQNAQRKALEMGGLLGVVPGSAYTVKELPLELIPAYPKRLPEEMSQVGVNGNYLIEPGLISFRSRVEVHFLIKE